MHDDVFAFEPRRARMKTTDSATVYPEYQNEPAELMLKRLKKQLSKHGMFALVHRRQHFVSRGQKRRSKSAAARKRAA